MLCPVYISEVTPANIRGRLSTVQQIMIITGLTGAFLANYVLANAAGGSTAEFWLGLPAWRWMFWMQVIPAGIFFLCLLFIPESPRYLVAKGKEAEAESDPCRACSARASGAGKVAEIRASLAARPHSPSSPTCWTRSPGSCARSCGPASVLAVFQQLVGINIVFYYGAVLWQSVGFTEDDALKINILSGALSILACLLAIGADRQDRPQAAAADRLGRHGRDAGPADLVLLDRLHGQRRAAPVRAARAWSPWSRPTPMWCSSTSAGAR